MAVTLYRQVVKGKARPTRRSIWARAPTDQSRRSLLPTVFAG